MSTYGTKRIVSGAHYGLRDWLAQRVTAVLMALFTIVLLVQVLTASSLDYYSWSGIFAPARTPKELVSRIGAEWGKVIKLPDVTQMMIEVKVHESHVRQVKPGLGAYVTIDSLPDKQFTGVVKKVAVLPDTASRYYNPNMKVYSTEVWINESLQDIKPGVSGRAEVVVTNLPAVLTVPIDRKSVV